MTTRPVEQIPSLERREAAVLAAAENARFVDLIRSLSKDDWSKQTDCPAWNVRAMSCHVLGAMEGNVSIPQFVHQLRAGNKAAGDRPAIDGMTEVQVRERRHLTPDQIREYIVNLAPRAARARARVPALLRRMPMKVEVEKIMETWRLGFLFDVIMTRDTWMHRRHLPGHRTARPAHRRP